MEQTSRSTDRDHDFQSDTIAQEGVKAFLKLLLCIPNIFKNYKSIWFKVVSEKNSLLAKDSIANLNQIVSLLLANFQDQLIFVF